MTPHSITALAARHSLSIDSCSIRLNTAGLDFLVAFARDSDGIDWVLRIPRRADVADKASLEGKILALVRRHLPVAVPEWRVFSPELIAYPLLPGTPGLTMDPTTDEPIWHVDRSSALFARSFGEALAALHGIDHEEARSSGLLVLTPSEVRSRYLEDMTTVRSQIGVADELWNRWQSWLDDDSIWPGFSTVIHGDLYAAHVLIDENNRATGILDWTEAKVADPATDFMFHLMGFGEDGFDRLVDAYTAAGGRVWPRLKEHCEEMLSAFSVNYALYAMLTGNEEHLAAAKAQLGVM